MKTTQNNTVSNQATANDLECDEINFVDYILILGKHKLLIVLGSMLPAVLAGLGLFFWPREYTVSYTYDHSISDVRAFKTLEDKFYSSENQEKLIGKLQEEGLDLYAKKLAEAQTGESLRECVSFQVSPSFIKPSGIKDFEELQKLQQVEGTLLDMRIVARPKENIRSIALVCRKNFEQIIPMYSEKEQLNSKVIQLKNEMASIEEARYMLDLKLRRGKDTLEKLKNSDSQSLDKLPGDLTLQFNNIGGDKAFLPLPYQIQAAETRIIDLEEEIRANKEQFDYYTDLLSLNEMIFSHVEKSMSSYYTLGQFHAFLVERLAEYKEGQQQLHDYLSAYVKGIENKMASAIPLVEMPGVYPTPKGTVKKSAVVFVISLLMSVFAAFLMEGVKNSKVQVS